MRITQSMYNRYQNQIQQNLSRLDDTQRKLSSGKVINKPSDDPTGVHQALKYQSVLAANEQYQKNTEYASTWLDEMDASINQAVTAIQRARELAVQGANGTGELMGRNSAAIEIDGILEQVRSLANTQLNGKYLFNGQKTDQAPYPTSTAYQTRTAETEILSVEVVKGIQVPINFDASKVFGEVGNNIFATLSDLSQSLRDGDPTAVANAIGKIDTDVDRMLASLTEVGARQKSVELAANRLAEQNTNLQAFLSKAIDTDYAEMITKLKAEESVYQASLSATARIIQPSLIDFLR